MMKNIDSLLVYMIKHALESCGQINWKGYLCDLMVLRWDCMKYRKEKWIYGYMKQSCGSAKDMLFNNKSGVYIMFNTINWFCYVGKTSGLGFCARWRTHFVGATYKGKKKKAKFY